MAGISFGPGVSELSSLKSIDDADILGNTKVRAAAGGDCAFHTMHGLK